MTFLADDGTLTHTTHIHTHAEKKSAAACHIKLLNFCPSKYEKVIVYTHTKHKYESVISQISLIKTKFQENQIFK